MKLHDWVTGQEVPGDWSSEDDHGNFPCPECGAEAGQQCSFAFDGDTRGVEVSAYVHVERTHQESSHGKPYA